METFDLIEVWMELKLTSLVYWLENNILYLLTVFVNRFKILSNIDVSSIVTVVT